tara:strand:- start:2367 stop:2900 length:534 start_codon:yes stop_codon:yes gene_type:complete
MLWNENTEVTNKLIDNIPENKYVEILLNKEIKTSIFQKFIENKQLPACINSQHRSTSIQLDCFRGVYKFPIHTDIAGKIITMVLYLASDNSMSQLGTNIYNDKKELVKNTGYIPNRLLIFVPSQTHHPNKNSFISYHNMEGVTSPNFRRHSIQAWYLTGYCSVGGQTGKKRSSNNGA